MATFEHTQNADVSSAALETYGYLDGEVFEVLEGLGLAHVRTADGRTIGLNRHTPGIEFSKLRDGARVRCKVARTFNRVLHAELII